MNAPIMLKLIIIMKYMTVLLVVKMASCGMTFLYVNILDIHLLGHLLLYCSITIHLYVSYIQYCFECIALCKRDCAQLDCGLPFTEYRASVLLTAHAVYE